MKKHQDKSIWQESRQSRKLNRCNCNHLKKTVLHFTNHIKLPHKIEMCNLKISSISSQDKVHMQLKGENKVLLQESIRSSQTHHNLMSQFNNKHQCHLISKTMVNINCQHTKISNSITNKLISNTRDQLIISEQIIQQMTKREWETWLLRTTVNKQISMVGKIQQLGMAYHQLLCKLKDILFHQDQSLKFKEHPMGFPSHKILNTWVQMQAEEIKENFLHRSDNSIQTQSMAKESLKNSFKNLELTRVQKC